MSTVDLLVLTSLDKLLFILKILFAFFTKQATFMRRSTVLSIHLQLVFPGWTVSDLRTGLFTQTKRNSLLINDAD